MAEMSNGTSRYGTEFILDQLFRAKRELGLNSGQFEVLCALVRHDCPDEEGRRKGEVWCSPKNGLHDLTGNHRGSLKRVLQSLEEKGAIKNLTPGNQGGAGNPNVWRINYQKMGWKSPAEKGTQNGSKGTQFESERDSICTPNLGMESRNEDPPPQSLLPLPQSQPPSPPKTEEEEFPFLSPDERASLISLKLSRAGWRMVDDAAPELLTQALQHIESHRTEIESAGFSVEQRFGAVLNRSYVIPESPPEPEPANGNGRKRYFCSFCGSVYSEEGHECTEG